jgi:hypothetical protein
MVKLTKKDMTTHLEFHYPLGKWVQAKGAELPLRLYCRGCLHLYETPAVAVFMSPHHEIPNYTRCFEAITDGKTITDGTIIGTRKVKLIQEIELPQPTTQQRLYFARLCGIKVGYTDLMHLHLTYLTHAVARQLHKVAALQAAHTAHCAARDGVNIVPLAERAIHQDCTDSEDKA